MANLKRIEQKINNYIVKRNLLDLESFRNLNVLCELVQRLYTSIDYKYSDFDRENLCLKSTKLSFFEGIKLIEDFYKHYHIDFNIDNVINDGTISFYFKPNSSGTGKNWYCDDKKLIDCNGEGIMLDVIVLAHELSHYRDQPDGWRGETNDLLTEALAYAEELVFVDYLRNLGFEQDAELLEMYNFHGFKYFARETSSSFRILNLYDELGSISKDNYSMLYGNTDNYDADLLYVENSIKNNSFNYSKNVDYVTGFPLGIYMASEVRKDPCFMDKIIKLHDKINTNSFCECLRFIGLNDLEDNDMDKIFGAVREYNKKEKDYKLTL